MKTDIKHLLKVVSLPLAISFVLPFADFWYWGVANRLPMLKYVWGYWYGVLTGHPRLFSAIRDTDSHRDYSTNRMDFTSMPAHGSLAGYRNLFLHWSANLYFGFFRWVAPQVEKGVVSLGVVHA